MPKPRFPISISPDGLVAGPNRRVDDPTGVGDDLRGLGLARTVATPNAVHLEPAGG